MPKERESIHTKEEIICGIAKVKRRFFSRSWYLWYWILVFRHMESPMPLNYWNVAEDLESLQSLLWEGLTQLQLCLWYKYHVRLMSAKGGEFGKLHNGFLCCFYPLFCANHTHHAISSFHKTQQGQSLYEGLASSFDPSWKPLKTWIWFRCLGKSPPWGHAMSFN